MASTMSSGEAARLSLFDWNGYGPVEDFVGLDNFRRALGDAKFLEAMRHNGVLVILSLAIQGPIAIGLALLLNRRFRGRAVLRTIFFAPFILSEAVAAVIWVLMLQPRGLVDQTMQLAGLGGFVQLWLADVDIVLYTLFVVISWKYIGLAIVLFLAGLQGIPRELSEAARIDGATPWQEFRYVTFPLLAPTVRIWAFLSIIGSIQLFDLVWIMTDRGGPANASNVMAVYMVDHGMIRRQYGYGSAVAVILFVVSLVVALLYQRYVLRRDMEGAITRMAR
jgi:raffinose/stachyose/melibiose transport system permease protein